MGEGLTPTHFGWRGDVAALVADIESRFSTFGNTYFDHPTGWGLDHVSVDFWAPFIGWDGVSGRGNNIDFNVGEAILDYVFNDPIVGPNPPYVRWYIWQGWMWVWDGTWTWYCDIDPLDCHFDHLHFTFW